MESIGAFLRRHKSILAAGILIALVLITAWFYGSDYTGAGGGTAPALSEQAQEAVSPLPGYHSEGAEYRDNDPDNSENQESAKTGEATEDLDTFTVFLTVRCDTVLMNMDRLVIEKHSLVPEDGIIYPMTAVTAYGGESVFDVLQRTMKLEGIHMSFKNTPVFGSAYIEAINNLYEFDAGDLSGWTYCVNGLYPNYGCSLYMLKPDDVVEWHYTCNLGSDLKEDWIEGMR